MLTTAGLGALIGFGQLLKSQAPITVRIVLGQALCAGGLGVSAGALFAFFPDLDPRAYIGVSCVLATLGANTFSMILARLAKADIENSKDCV
jgi:hypothetical protein